MNDQQVDTIDVSNINGRLRIWWLYHCTGLFYIYLVIIVIILGSSNHLFFWQKSEHRKWWVSLTHHHNDGASPMAMSQPMNEWGPFLTCTLTSGQILLSFSLWCLLSELLLFFVGNTKFRLLSEKMRLAFFFIQFYLISHSSCLVLILIFIPHTHCSQIMSYSLFYRL